MLPAERLGVSQPVTVGGALAQALASDVPGSEEPPVDVRGTQAPAPAAAVGREPPVRLAPQEVVVQLESGQTLMGLAEAHLGSRQRYKEILRCNGWTEQSARRLPIGQRVRIPVAAAGDR